MHVGPGVTLSNFAACDRFDVMDQVGEIRQPTLVVASAADLLTPVKVAHFVNDGIPGAQCAVFEEAGHMVMLERPESTAQAIGRFLESVNDSCGAATSC